MAARANDGTSELADDMTNRVGRAPCPVVSPVFSSRHPNAATQKGTVVAISTNDLHARQHVGRRLRAMRETAGFTLDVAARHVHLPAHMLEQMESGQHAVPPPLAQAMTRMYGHPDPDVLLMTRLTRHRGRVDDFADWHLDQLAWECCATRVCEVAVTHIPELLHTSAYARAVWTSHAHTVFGWQIMPALCGDVAEHSIQTGLAALALRQGRLAGRPWLPMHVVITEEALRAALAAPQVMAEQWAHLITLITRCAVTVRVLPRAHSGLISAQHGWRVLEFSNTPEPRWLFRRYGGVTAASEDEQQVATAYRKYLQLRAATLSADDSQIFIQQLINDAQTVSKGSTRPVSRQDARREPGQPVLRAGVRR
jgi:hypothetical protein